MRSLLLALSTVLLAACHSTPPAPPMVGGDRDAHGCIGSAGYVWCAAQGQCVRPWELPQASNSTPEANFAGQCTPH